MLRTTRAAFAILCLVLLATGYALSQLAYPGRAKEYARAVDQPWVWFLSLALVATAVVLFLIPQRGDD